MAGGVAAAALLAACGAGAAVATSASSQAVATQPPATTAAAATAVAAATVATATSSTVAAQAGAAGQKTTLRLFDGGNPTEDALIKAIVKAFLQANPDLDVTNRADHGRLRHEDLCHGGGEHPT